MTGGGSESNIAAVLASVAYMKESKGISEPEILIAETAHASFWKAARIARAKYASLPPAPPAMAVSLTPRSALTARAATLSACPVGAAGQQERHRMHACGGVDDVLVT
jgi:glutamate/tyrosine decarboxylase-like PLP-dependent enzyme